MANYIFDSSKSRVVICNPDRLTRTGISGKPFRCPFDSGNEADTPPEVLRVGPGEVNSTGWEIRVVPNKFLITDIHEVVIHSPDHEKNFEDFGPEKVEKIIKVYRDRFNALKEKGRVYVFSNYALSSGASLIHPHSQIIVVPENIKTSTLAFQPVVNIVDQNDSFTAYCPEYSEWSYETWITGNREAKTTGETFGSLDDNGIKKLAEILQKMIKKLKSVHDKNTSYSKKPFGYNFYITPDAEWYLRIIPRFIERAGVELATGIMVNSVDAKKASEDLKNA